MQHCDNRLLMGSACLLAQAVLPVNIAHPDLCCSADNTSDGQYACGYSDHVRTIRGVMMNLGSHNMQYGYFEYNTRIPGRRYASTSGRGVKYTPSLHNNVIPRQYGDDGVLFQNNHAVSCKPPISWQPQMVADVWRYLSRSSVPVCSKQQGRPLRKWYVIRYLHRTSSRQALV